jgi:hypothetical protein
LGAGFDAGEGQYAIGCLVALGITSGGSWRRQPEQPGLGELGGGGSQSRRTEGDGGGHGLGDPKLVERVGLGLGKPRSRALCPGWESVDAVHGREYERRGGRRGETKRPQAKKGKKKTKERPRQNHELGG